MPRTEKEVKYEIADLLKRMRELLDTAEDEHRELNVAEEAEYRALDTKIDVLKEEIKRNQRREEIEIEEKRVVNPLSELLNGYKKTSQPTNSPAMRCEDVPGFKTKPDEMPAEDFFKCLLNRDYGPLKDYRAEARTGVALGSGVAGGYAVPEIVVVNTLDKLLQDQGVFSRIGKEFVEPGTGDTLHAVTFENSEIDANGLYGFSRPTFIGEGQTIPEETPKLVRRTWELKKLAMGTRISIEATVAGNNLQNKVSDAMAGALRWGLEYYVVQGTGVNQPRGLVNSSCMYSYPRAGAGAISFADISGMYAKTRLQNNVWIASQEVLPQLVNMVDTGNHSIFLPGQGQTGAAMQVPNTLFGAPLLTNMGASPGLGEKGDIALCSDLSFYKAVIWQGLIVRVSDAPYWSTGEIGMQVIMLLDCGALPVNMITVDSQTYGWGTVLV